MLWQRKLKKSWHAEMSRDLNFCGYSRANHSLPVLPYTHIQNAPLEWICRGNNACRWQGIACYMEHSDKMEVIYYTRIWHNELVYTIKPVISACCQMEAHHFSNIKNLCLFEAYLYLRVLSLMWDTCCMYSILYIIVYYPTAEDVYKSSLLESINVP